MISSFSDIGARLQSSKDSQKLLLPKSLSRTSKIQNIG